MVIQNWTAIDPLTTFAGFIYPPRSEDAWVFITMGLFLITYGFIITGLIILTKNDGASA